MIVLPRKTREEQSPFLYKGNREWKARRLNNYFMTLMKKLLPCEKIASMKNKLYHRKMSRGRKLKPLPSQKVDVKSWNSLIYKDFSDFVH